MIPRQVFSAVMGRLREAGHATDSDGVFSEIGFVFLGDSGQIHPIGDKMIMSTIIANESGKKKAASAISEFRIFPPTCTKKVDF